jgi:hypothetical protein
VHGSPLLACWGVFLARGVADLHGNARVDCLRSTLGIHKIIIRSGNRSMLSANLKSGHDTFLVNNLLSFV